jgi:hypothetical protein
MSGQGVGPWGRQVPLPPRLPAIRRGALDRGLPFGSHACGLREPRPARLPEPCRRSPEANLRKLRSPIRRHARAVAPPAALQLDQVVSRAKGAEALGDVRSLRPEALGLWARGGRFLGDLGEPCGGLWGAPRPPCCRGIARALQVALVLAQAARALPWQPAPRPAA